MVLAPGGGTRVFGVLNIHEIDDTPVIQALYLLLWCETLHIFIVIGQAAVVTTVLLIVNILYIKEQIMLAIVRSSVRSVLTVPELNRFVHVYNYINWMLYILQQWRQLIVRCRGHSA